MRTFDIRQWTFILADEPDAWAKGFDDTGWRTLTVPHDWSVEQPFSSSWSSGTGYLPGGIGWYRAHIALSTLGEVAGTLARLVFHGVYKNAQVWVNGYHVGGRPSGYAEFSFDLTEILSYANGDDLVISVRVEHTDISDSRWYNGSGITRRVSLELHQALRVKEHGTTFTTLSADAAAASIKVATTLVNDAAETVTAHVRHDLRSLASERTHRFEAELQVPAGGFADAIVTTEVPQPELWSDTSPSLYRLTTTLVWSAAGSEHQAVYEETVGIRTFRFDADHGFSINGEARKLKGVCLHEDAGCLGTAVPNAVWLRRLLKLKHMGCNAVRMAHNPHAPELYRMCDALGFFVIDEAFDEWENAKNKWWQGHNVYPPRHQGYAKDFHDWHERDLVAMVGAHRNHPSIIAWSIGNEIDYPNDPYASAMFEAMTGNNDANKSAKQRAYDPNRPDARRLPTLAKRLAAIVRQSDPTRPVTVGAAFPELSRHTGFFDELDVVGYNYKEYLYEGDHAHLPHKPLLGSENGHRYTDWLHAAEKDYIAGQFLWTGIDYLGEAHGWPIHGSGAGLLTIAGFEKHTYHLRRSWWSDAPVAHIVTRPYVDEADKNFWSHPIARNWNDTAGSAIEVLCFTNKGTPRLTCGEQEIALTHDAEHGYWVAVMPPNRDPLVLEALRDGAVVARDHLRPTEEAAKLDAVVWQAPADAVRQCADAGLATDDVIQIECTLRDAQGNIACDERMVSVEVEGGTLLGLENGDLRDNTAYTLPQRRTLDGRLIIYVRPNGRAIVRLNVPGLPDIRL
ncbi:glycoside hydrolase family 2 TIM barrel-domain containing protein [Devosia sp.]|uniref:glycoside hydrolase family 2 TIM barrel-domain containing protein n=1 Tax=Devosia sp. TaxID=1871048 RepID=UPI003BAC72C8